MHDGITLVPEMRWSQNSEINVKMKRFHRRIAQFRVFSHYTWIRRLNDVVQFLQGFRTLRFIVYDDGILN